MLRRTAGAYTIPVLCGSVRWLLGIRATLALLVCGSLAYPEAGKIGTVPGERLKVPKRLSRR